METYFIITSIKRVCCALYILRENKIFDKKDFVNVTYEAVTKRARMQGLVVFIMQDSGPLQNDQ